eukprot:1146143-Pelagomonas_calceolata.AAC.2
MYKRIKPVVLIHERKHSKRLYMVYGRQVRSHLWRRVGEREERAGEQGSILEPKRTDLGVRAFEKNIMLSITNITGRRTSVILCSTRGLLDFGSMDTKTKSGHAV